MTVSHSVHIFDSIGEYVIKIGIFKGDKNRQIIIRFDKTNTDRDLTEKNMPSNIN